MVGFAHKLVAALREQSPVGRLWIVQRDRIRIRSAG